MTRFQRECSGVSLAQVKADHIARPGWDMLPFARGGVEFLVTGWIRAALGHRHAIEYGLFLLQS